MNPQQITDYLVKLVDAHPLAMHSPFYTNPCSKGCKVCNMDKQLYRMVRTYMEDQRKEANA